MRLPRPLVAFLLIASVGILFAGCGPRATDEADTVTFTEEESEEITRLLDRIEREQAGTGTAGTVLPPLPGEPVVLDASRAKELQRLRAESGELPPDAFRVTNAFLNVRATPSVSGEFVTELRRGDWVTVMEFPNAAWARVRLGDGREGYVSTSYVAKVTTDAQLPAEKAAYDGQFYVDFSFLNVRSSPTNQGDKLGELSANAIVTPIAIQGDWARIPFEGREGFVSRDYLKPFVPNFLVRQDTFALPVLHMQIDTEESVTGLLRLVAFLKERKAAILSLRDFEEILIAQEDRDLRLAPGSVLLVLSQLRPDLARAAADGLQTSGVAATVFLETGTIGAEGGLAPSLVKSLAASGLDVQAAGHSGDDLRSLTNSQITLELSESKRTLEPLTGQPVTAVLYPRSGVNDRVTAQAAELGYLFGVTLNPASSFERSQFLRLPSILVAPDAPEEMILQYIGAQ